MLLQLLLLLLPLLLLLTLQLQGKLFPYLQQCYGFKTEQFHLHHISQLQPSNVLQFDEKPSRKNLQTGEVLMVDCVGSAAEHACQ